MTTDRVVSFLLVAFVLAIWASGASAQEWGKAEGLQSLVEWVRGNLMAGIIAIAFFIVVIYSSIERSWLSFIVGSAVIAAVGGFVSFVPGISTWLTTLG